MVKKTIFSLQYKEIKQYENQFNKLCAFHLFSTIRELVCAFSLISCKTCKSSMMKIINFHLMFAKAIFRIDFKIDSCLHRQLIKKRRK